MTDDHVTLRLSRETIETILRSLHVLADRGDGHTTYLTLKATGAMHDALAEQGLSLSVKTTEPRRKRLFRR